MVEFTAPVFWLFFLLAGHRRCSCCACASRSAERPFRVPLYPLLPLLFCATCAYMLWSSLSYVYSQSLGGMNAAWIGVAVLAVGLRAAARWCGDAVDAGRVPVQRPDPEGERHERSPQSSTAQRPAARSACCAGSPLPCALPPSPAHDTTPQLDVPYVPTPQAVVDKMLEHGQGRHEATCCTTWAAATAAS